MVWDGIERRKTMQTCEQHQQLFADVQVIKNTLTNLDNKIGDSLKWRISIVCALIGVIGIFINGSIKFGVIESKAIASESEIKDIKNQIYDLNYVKGKTEGYNEAKSK